MVMNEITYSLIIDLKHVDTENDIDFFPKMIAALV